MSTLSAQSHEYSGKIASSKLYCEATYWAYRQYNILPKVRFSLPAQSLLKQECECIQFPAICVMHFNQNTSWAIVFGPTKYAGINLPHLYTIQSTEQIQLLQGHLHQKKANLIFVYISTIQLLIGSSTLFFDLPYLPYH
jgi:hypothetical protein